MFKKIISVLLVCVFVMSFLSVPASAETPIKVYITYDNGKTKDRIIFYGTDPIIIDGRTMIPVRGLFEKMGYTVEWNDALNKATIKNDYQKAVIGIGESYIKVNSRNVKIDVPAKIRGSRTIIPLRAVSEAFGLKVTWDGKTRSVVVYGEKSKDSASSDSNNSYNSNSNTSNSSTGNNYYNYSQYLENGDNIIWNSSGNTTSNNSGTWYPSSGNTNAQTKPQQPAEPPKPTTYDKYGSAAYIGNKTVIVSIFATDPNTPWDFNKKEDNDVANLLLKHLRTAVNWITAEVAKYGVKAEFAYDWAVSRDFLYGARFSVPVISLTGENYTAFQEYIKNSINTEELKKKYNAENIIYMFFFNTPYSNQDNSCAFTKTPQGSRYDEAIEINYRYDDKFIVEASVLAHEILHIFGAKDLYYSSDTIPQSYVDYSKNNSSNDIMYTVCMGDVIYNEFTPLDAYYLGIASEPAEVANWGLGKSDYDILK